MAKRFSICPRFSMILMVVAIAMLMCISLSGCLLVHDALKSSGSSRTCDDYFHRACRWGIGVHADDDHILVYDWDSIKKEIDKQNLKGEEAALYERNAQVQQLSDMYLRAQNYCKEKYSSHVDYCSAYALNLVLYARNNLYFNTNNLEKNPYVVPQNDEVFLTEVFNGYYNDLPENVRHVISSNSSVMTAEEIKAKKATNAKEYIEKYYLKSVPQGESNPQLERLVMDYLNHYVPDLKIESVVFGKNWNIIRDDDDNILRKVLLGVVIVRVPGDNKVQYVMHDGALIYMNHEGGGKYSDPYCADNMQRLVTTSHNINLSFDEVELEGTARSVKEETDYFHHFHSPYVYVPIIP